MALNDKVIQQVVKGSLSLRGAAKVLGVSHTTVGNYVKKFLHGGPEGLSDLRQGHFHKLTGGQEADIVARKRHRPNRSARWIRDRLGLPLSVETVRLILVKHHLMNRKM